MGKSISLELRGGLVQKDDKSQNHIKLARQEGLDGLHGQQ